MKNSGKASLDTISFKNLRRLYLFALLTIAVTVLLSQLLIQYNLNSQLSDSKIINISGKQRMLSQRLTKEVLILNFIPKEKTQTLIDLFLQIKPNFDQIINASTLFLKNKKSNQNQAENEKLVQIILDNEGVFLSKMNQIVGEYEKEALEKVRQQSKTEYAILGFTLLVLLLEFIFIFKPTNAKIESLFSCCLPLLLKR